MNKIPISPLNLRNYAGKIFLASAFLLSMYSLKAQRCDVNGISYTQQAGFGSNSKIMVGGYGMNDGSICWNCYPDSSVFGRSRIFNRPVGILPPAGSPVPMWSARMFQDGPANIMRIQTSQIGALGYCYDSVTWNKGLSLRTDGSLGIGTDQTFGYKLAVNGGIIAKNDIRTTLLGVTWPDYVFAPTYRLKPLPELAQEIDSLGHLPEMPSAAEVEADGVSLPQMSAKLLKKVEELTLYVIELQKQLIALQSQNGQQQSEIKVQQKQIEELKALIETLLKEKE